MVHNVDMDVELADLISKKLKEAPESALTIKWAVVFAVIIACFAFLFGGFTSNANRLTRLETQYDFLIKNISDLKASQQKIEALTEEIRYDQRRRQLKEK